MSPNDSGISFSVHSTRVSVNNIVHNAENDSTCGLAKTNKQALTTADKIRTFTVIKYYTLRFI